MKEGAIRVLSTGEFEDREMFVNGTWKPIPSPDQLDGMLVPVSCCRCGSVYDLCAVPSNDIKSRHADCTVYISPCCKQVVDDRRWKSLPDIEDIDRNKL